MFSKIADFEKDRADFIAQQKAVIIASQFQVDEDDEYDGTFLNSNFCSCIFIDSIEIYFYRR